MAGTDSPTTIRLGQSGSRADHRSPNHMMTGTPEADPAATDMSGVLDADLRPFSGWFGGTVANGAIGRRTVLDVLAHHWRRRRRGHMATADSPTSHQRSDDLLGSNSLTEIPASPSYTSPR